MACAQLRRGSNLGLAEPSIRGSHCPGPHCCGRPIFKYGDVATSARAEAPTAGEAEQDEPQPTGSASDSPSPPPPPPPPPDPLTIVLDELASGGLQLLCLDELQVTDVADAMLVRRLFEGLFSRGVRVVFTSNREPEQLYERGLNRRYFLPFMALVRERCAVVGVGHGIDYRTLPPPSVAAGTAAASGASPQAKVLAPRARGRLYASDGELTAAWDGLGGAPRSRSLPVAFGRMLTVRVRHDDSLGGSESDERDGGGDGGGDGDGGGVPPGGDGGGDGGDGGVQPHEAVNATW